jgi:hypothetical protein
LRLAPKKKMSPPTTDQSGTAIAVTDRGDSCACTELVTTALASAKPMKRLLKMEAVMRKLMTRMTIPRINTRTL